MPNVGRIGSDSIRGSYDSRVGLKLEQGQLSPLPLTLTTAEIQYQMRLQLACIGQLVETKQNLNKSAACVRWGLCFVIRFVYNCCCCCCCCQTRPLTVRRLRATPTLRPNLSHNETQHRHRSDSALHTGGVHTADDVHLWSVNAATTFNTEPVIQCWNILIF